MPAPPEEPPPAPPTTHAHDDTPPTADALAALQRLANSVPHAAMRLAARGIANPGNLCFANATLQALLASPLFCALLTDAAAAQPLLKDNAVALTCLATLHQQLNCGGASAATPLASSTVMPLVQAFVRTLPHGDGAVCECYLQGLFCKGYFARVHKPPFHSSSSKTRRNSSHSSLTSSTTSCWPCGRRHRQPKNRQTMRTSG